MFPSGGNAEPPPRHLGAPARRGTSELLVSLPHYRPHAAGREAVHACRPVRHSTDARPGGGRHMGRPALASLWLPASGPRHTLRPGSSPPPSTRSAEADGTSARRLANLPLDAVLLPFRQIGEGPRRTYQRHHNWRSAIAQQHRGVAPGGLSRRSCGWQMLHVRAFLF